MTDKDAMDNIRTLHCGDCNNPPLTLEELRNLTWKEPVYAVSRADKGHWCVIDTDLCGGGVTAIVPICGMCFTLSGDDYGDSWLAYQRKPEET